MKPVIEVNTDNSIIMITLGLDMSRGEIQDFLFELEQIVKHFNENDTTFSVLNDASKKTFTDLDAVQELSIGMRRVLALGKINRVAVYRPQGDYAVSETENHSGSIQVFDQLDTARYWLVT